MVQWGYKNERLKERVRRKCARFSPRSPLRTVRLTAAAGTKFQNLTKSRAMIARAGATWCCPIF